MQFHLKKAAVAVTALSTAFGIAASSAAANPIKLPTFSKELAQLHARAAHRAINPPAPPCPEYGQLPSPFSSCGLPETPAAGVPYPGNMAYWGGPVETHPHVYLVYWGWGESGAFKGFTPSNCSTESFTEGSISATLSCDPEHTGKYMADFVQQMGGTPWAGVATQYYEADSAGTQTPVSNDKNVLAGVWVDDSNDASGLAKSNADNPPGSTNTYTLLAQEATRAAQHFGVSATDMKNANFVIAQPPAFSDPNALSQGYCAFHDYTLPGIEGGIYNASTGVKSNMAWTNMPYVNAITSGGANDCAEDSVNPPPQGNNDAFSIVLGHEIEEAVTDPGAEDAVGSYPSQKFYGGWYDTIDANENGDKCAYVGFSPLAGLAGPNVLPIPGALGNITGNAGGTFAVQSTWSNNSAAGAGYCAGVNDLPGPLAGGEGGALAKPAPTPTHGAKGKSGHKTTKAKGTKGKKSTHKAGKATTRHV